jgi:predicted DNA-binding transcriptional regulator AlpA
MDLSLPLRIRAKEVCRLLNISRTSLNRKMKTDPHFPRGVKVGSLKQSPLYFDRETFLNWYNNTHK